MLFKKEAAQLELQEGQHGSPLPAPAGHIYKLLNLGTI